MSWDVIEKESPTKINLPKEGAVISSRRAMKNARYISVLLGPETSRAGLLTGETHRVTVMLGRGENAGKIAIMLDMSAGKFEAKRQKNGGYRVTIGRTVATQRLDFDMAMITVEDVQRVPMRGGGPPILSITCPQAFV